MVRWCFLYFFSRTQTSLLLAYHRCPLHHHSASPCSTVLASPVCNLPRSCTIVLSKNTTKNGEQAFVPHVICAGDPASSSTARKAASAFFLVFHWCLAFARWRARRCCCCLGHVYITSVEVFSCTNTLREILLVKNGVMHKRCPRLKFGSKQKLDVCKHGPTKD